MDAICPACGKPADDALAHSAVSSICKLTPGQVRMYWDAAQQEDKE